MADATTTTTTTPQEDVKEAKKAKTQWNLKRCLRAGRRFESLDEWAKGAPASFKAAQARGYLEQWQPPKAAPKSSRPRTGKNKGAA